MHELSLAEALLAEVARAAAARPGAAVRRVEVTVGALAGLEPALLAQAFAVLRPGTLCADAELALVPLDAGWRCPGCGRGFAPGERLRCAACDRPAALAPGGDAVTLSRIELEVP